MVLLTTSIPLLDLSGTLLDVSFVSLLDTLLAVVGTGETTTGIAVWPVWPVGVLITPPCTPIGDKVAVAVAVAVAVMGTGV